jgi:hypothetical protein
VTVQTQIDRVTLEAEERRMMKRWENLPVLAGFLAVVAFTAARFWGVRTALTGFRELSPRVVQLLFYFATVIAMFLAMVWAAGLPWRKGRRASAEPTAPSSVLRRPKVAVAALSVALGMAAEGLTGRRTPGTYIVGWVLFRLQMKPGFFGLLLFFVVPLVLGSVVSFGALWGFYVGWERFLGRIANSKVRE